MARLMTEQLGKGFAQRVGTFADHAKALHHIVKSYADVFQELRAPLHIEYEGILGSPEQGITHKQCDHAAQNRRGD